MKEIISDFYKEKGFSAVYVVTNSDPRRVAVLRKNDGTMTSMSYAKYLYTSFHKCDVNPKDHVDHINGDKLDDRIENLQVISGTYNRQKDHRRKEMVLMTCPICGKEFLFDKRNLPFHPNPCCSRECGYKKTSQTLLSKNKNGGNYKHKCEVCGKPFRAVDGKKYCSKECREIGMGRKDKRPSKEEVFEKYDELKSWDKVSEYYGMNRRSILRIRNK